MLYNSEELFVIVEHEGNNNENYVIGYILPEEASPALEFVECQCDVFNGNSAEEQRHLKLDAFVDECDGSSDGDSVEQPGEAEESGDLENLSLEGLGE